METLSDRNIQFLRAHFPELAPRIALTSTFGPYSYSDSPKPNILYRNKPFHSTTKPEAEAHNLVKDLTLKAGTVIVFLGVGLGYHVELFRNLYSAELTEATVIVIEKSIEAFSLLVRHRDITYLEGMHLFIGEKAEKVKKFIDTLDPLSFKGYRIIRLRGAYTLFPGYYRAIETHFKSTLSGRISDLLTRFAFESLWMKNIIDNIPSFTGKRSIWAIKGALRNQPVLVVSAGPSLLEQLELIGHIQERINIIAVDTAVGPLLKHEIYPDFVVTLDAGFYNYLDFRDLFTGASSSSFKNLVADIVVCPMVPKNWKGDIFFSETAFINPSSVSWYSNNHPLISFFHEFFPHSVSLNCGGSVSTTAIELALHMEACPVLITGLDLSYTQFKTHVNSSTHYNEFYCKADRFRSLETFMVSVIGGRKLKYLPGIRTPSVLSDFIFSKYLEWIESRKEYRETVVNVTLEGARIGGLEHHGLREFADHSLSLEKKLPLWPRSRPRLANAVARRFLEALKDSVGQAREDLNNRIDIEPLVRKYGFLRNNILEAQALYESPDSFRSHILLFLWFLEKHIDRSIQRLNRRKYYDY